MLHPRPATIWRCRNLAFRFQRAMIMGVVNVTPDSFSDGGRFLDPDAALRHATAMLEAGADLLDVGGESSRPGAEAISEAEELRRVIPVIEAIRRRHREARISIDTTKAAVAEAALAAGAVVVNDISAAGHDPRMAGVVRESGAGLVLMHMRGTPRTMQDDPRYEDVVADIRGYLAERVEAMVAAGVERERLAVDPGIGFGKDLAHNLRLVAGLREFAALGRPVLLGLSRKRFLGAITGREPGDRLPASLAGLCAGVLLGAHIVRVHDVRESRDAAAVMDALLDHA